MEQQPVFFSITVEKPGKVLPIHGLNNNNSDTFYRGILIIASCFSLGSFFVVENSEGSRVMVMRRVDLVWVKQGYFSRT